MQSISTLISLDNLLNTLLKMLCENNVYSTVFMIFFSEGRLVLSPTQQVTDSERVKFSKKNQKKSLTFVRIT